MLRNNIFVPIYIVVYCSFGVGVNLNFKPFEFIEITKSSSYDDLFGSVEEQFNVIMILSRILEIRQ